MSLSVIIITKNEGAVIRRCLKSVAWANEIIVVDAASSDNTAEICRELGAKVYIVDDWPGFGPQKNRALEFATNQWLLSLDADEEVSAELRTEIEAAMLAAGKNVAFRMPRLSSYCGRYIRHSGWWPDHITRLFLRGKARFSNDVVHERLIVDGAIGTLSQPLIHEAFTDAEEVLEKINRYSTASAQTLHRQGKTSSLSSALLHGLWAFIRSYILRAGFLDGREGLMLAISNAEGTYYRYIKLMLLSKQK